MRRLIVMSGQVSSGKSTLAEGLSKRFGFEVLRTKDWLKRRLRAKGTPSRKDLQTMGDRLDIRTGGKWVVQELTKNLPALASETVILDSTRTKEQVEELRAAFGPIVTHIHLTAPRDELELRFKKRMRTDKRELATYRVVRENKTELQVGSLREVADIVIDTNRCTPDDVLIRAASHLGLYSTSSKGYVDVLIGGQYGSEGKR